MPPSRTSSKPISCAECRRLKIRCNLEFPCAPCTKRGVASICPEGELVQGLHGQRVLAGTEELHRRIAELEAALRTAILRPSGQRDLTTIGSNQHLVVGDDSERTRYFGAASSAYLSRRSRPIPNNIPHLFNLPLPNSSSQTISIPPLPERHEAERLGSIYYSTFGWFTNIVPLESWHTKYLDPVYQDPKAYPQRMAVIFLILALAAGMETPPDPDTVETYSLAARLSYAADSTHSVTLVQAIYLYVTFVMNGRNDKPGGEVGWLFLRAGMAMVEALGLHREPSHWDITGEAATERRIVFWEIHGYDVLQSIALGRGQCIADHAIDCNLPMDGDVTGFHRKAYELTRIWSKINDRQIRTTDSTYDEVCATDDALNEYAASLPEHLSTMIPPSLLDYGDVDRRRLLFRRTQLLMYLAEARVALHRSWFVKILRENASDPLSSPQSRSFLSCLEACRNIIVLVRNTLSLPEQHIQRRWHFFFHLFSACACLAACVIRAPTSILARPVYDDLEHGVELFKRNHRDETAQLEELKARAFAALGGHHVDNHEDLDLLSASSTIRKDVAPISFNTGPQWDFDAVPFPRPQAEFDMDAFLEDLGLVSPY